MEILSKGIFIYQKNCNNKILRQITYLQKIKNNKNIKINIPKLVDLINKQNLNEYLKIVVNFSFEANKYFNDSEPGHSKKKILIE